MLRKEMAGLTTLCFTGMMVALSVVFCRFLGFPQSGLWRFDPGILPIFAVAVLFGPLWAGVAYGTADLIGAAIFTGINPLIVLEKVLVGAVMGVGFYNREKIGWFRLAVTLFTVALCLDFLMMTPIFHYYFGYPWPMAWWVRFLNSLMNFAFRFLMFAFMDNRLTKRLLTEKRKYYG